MATEKSVNRHSLGVNDSIQDLRRDSQFHLLDDDGQVAATEEEGEDAVLRTEDVEVDPRPPAPPETTTDEAASSGCIRRVRLVEPVAIGIQMCAIFIGLIETQYIYHTIAEKVSNTTVDRDSTGSLCKIFNDSGDPNATAITDKIQKYTSFYNTFSEFAKALPNVLALVFIGPLTDIFGRKLALILGAIGGAFKVAMTLLTFLTKGELWILLVGDFILGFTENTTLAAFAYLADITTQQNRTFRVTVLQGLLMVFIGLGVFVYNAWLQAAGAVIIWHFVPLLIIYVLVLLYTVFMLQETVVRHKDKKYKPIQNVKTICRLTLDEKGKPFTQFIFFTIAFAIISVTFNDHKLIYLYQMNRPLCWQPMRIGIYTCSYLLLNPICLALSAKFLGPIIKDSGLIIMGAVSGTASTILEGFSTNDAMMFSCIPLGCVKGLCVSVLKALLSKLHPEADNGLLFTYIIFVETLGRFLGTLMLNSVYGATVATEPGTAFFVCSGLYFTTGAVVGSVLWQQHGGAAAGKAADKNDPPVVINGSYNYEQEVAEVEGPFGAERVGGGEEVKT